MDEDSSADADSPAEASDCLLKKVCHTPSKQHRSKPTTSRSQPRPAEANPLPIHTSCSCCPSPTWDTHGPLRQFVGTRCGCCVSSADSRPAAPVSRADRRRSRSTSLVSAFVIVARSRRWLLLLRAPLRGRRLRLCQCRRLLRVWKSADAGY